MLCVTRLGVGLNATATAWLIRRFLDPLGSLVFLPAERVAEAERLQGAVGFDAPGARYSEAGGRGRGSFESLVREHYPDDPALVRFAAIVRDADARRRWDTPLVRLAALAYEARPQPPTVAPESAGLWAISEGFGEAGRDDPDVVGRAAFLYDSLYAHLRRRSGS